MRGVCEWLGVDALPGFEGQRERERMAGAGKWWEDVAVRGRVLAGELLGARGELVGLRLDGMGMGMGLDGMGVGEGMGEWMELDGIGFAESVDDQRILSPAFEHWLRYWKPMAHGFVVREPGAEPEFWCIDEGVRGHGIEDAHLGERNGWVADREWLAHWSVDLESWDGLVDGVWAVDEERLVAEGGGSPLSKEETLVADEEYQEYQEEYLEMLERIETGGD